ncbi:WapI family immunity protein [Actinoplanes sp. HUAS TT8]|uniref:WapI family immunity protein n=1 Tax=Actinoplanes sp. HUAS TT8 TaxID=3447453 RepID=UPI003F51E999
MQIASETGGWLSMRPLRYEFDDEPDGPLDDWLVVSVAAADHHGHTWQSESPCLTVAETIELADWLRGHRAAGELGFIEPNVAFRQFPSDDGQHLLEVAFSHENLPPWLPGSGLGRVHRIRLEVTEGVLNRAGVDWAAEIAAFPPRADLADW